MVVIVQIRKMKTFLKERTVTHCNKENSDSQLLYNFQKKARAGDKEPRRKDKDAFVERVNGYIESITLQNKMAKPTAHIPRQLFEVKSKKEKEKTVSRNSSRDKVASLSKKLKAEKAINKNLQKAIIQIQKILWQRNDRLEVLEQELTCDKLLSRDSYEQYQQASEESSTKAKATESDLKRYANSLGLKKILHSLNNEEIQETSQYSDTKNSQSQASSLDGHKSYIKIERPRTESESEMPSKRRK